MGWSGLSTTCGQNLWMVWTPDRVAWPDGRAACGRRLRGCPQPGTLRGMQIEIRAAEVHALADRLQVMADEADDAGALLDGHTAVGAALQPAVEAFLDCHRAAARAMAGELAGSARRRRRWPTPGWRWTRPFSAGAGRAWND